MNFQMFILDLEKAEEPDIKLPSSTGSSNKQESSRKKKSTSVLLTTPNPLTVWIRTNYGKFFNRWGYHLNCLLKNLYASQEATVELDIEQEIGSKLGKEYVKSVYCHSAYLTYMQSTS